MNKLEELMDSKDFLNAAFENMEEEPVETEAGELVVEAGFAAQLCNKATAITGI